MPSQQQHPPSSRSSDRPGSQIERLAANPFWALVIVSGAAFALTCLVMVAATLGDPHGPMNRLVRAYGTSAAGIETIVLVLSALGAMTVDRIQTLRQEASARPDE